MPSTGSRSSSGGGGLSSLLCSCYSPKKTRNENSKDILDKNKVSGNKADPEIIEEPYARINKMRNSTRQKSQVLRLSTAGEIDIDEIGGYATILKTPKLPRKLNAETLNSEKTIFVPSKIELTVPPPPPLPPSSSSVLKKSAAPESFNNRKNIPEVVSKSEKPITTSTTSFPLKTEKHRSLTSSSLISNSTSKSTSTKSPSSSRQSLTSFVKEKKSPPSTPLRRSSQESSSLKLTSSSSSNSNISNNMAMIATVHPYNRKNSGFKIEDVTDDPKYQNNDEGELEGALVEYCRIDSRNYKPQHSVCEASTVVSARGNNNNDKHSFSTGIPAPPTSWKSSTVANQHQMAHIIDVEVGQPCSAMAQCKCFGFRPHPWRKVCVHCKCDRTEHEIGPNQVLNVYERLGIKPTPDMAAVMKNQRSDTPGSISFGYAWVPPGLNRVKVEEYMSQLPNHVIPRINSLGEKYREKQLMLQLPRQDLSIAYCKNLKTPVERRIYEEFVNARNEIALDIGYVSSNLPKSMECRKCRGILEQGEMAVTAPKLGENAAWHPACFTCQTCEQLLVDLTYCVKEDKIFCERHYAELHKPRCSACDELIFAGEYTKAMNKDWHSDHFSCWNCDCSLTGQRYILRDDHPFCIKCYEEVFANTCDECAKPIGIDSKDLSYKERHWHEGCFICSECKLSLVDKPFGSKNDHIYCSNCYDQAFATRCDGCNEIFRAGMKKMEYKGRQWHEKCFCCAVCKVPIGTKSFIPKNDDVFCANCYEEKFATRCSKCKKVITTGGVTYKNEPWHRECFCCTACNSSLAGQRFTSKDEKPYCANCYGEMFAKRCSACVKPITGIGGAKFISFEDRSWHNDCFTCAQCTTSLVGKGFITDSADILCPECAKARLMAANS